MAASEPRRRGFSAGLGVTDECRVAIGTTVGAWIGGGAETVGGLSATFGLKKVCSRWSERALGFQSSFWLDAALHAFDVR